MDKTILCVLAIFGLAILVVGIEEVFGMGMAMIVGGFFLLAGVGVYYLDTGHTKHGR